MTKTEAIQKAKEFLNSKRIKYGQVFNITKAPYSLRRTKTLNTGDLWSIVFEQMFDGSEHCTPNCIIVEVEDTTGESRIFNAL